MLSPPWNKPITKLILSMALAGSVIDAKKKLSEFEHKVLPAVRTKNSTDGAALDTFFRDMDRALDALTYTY
jgi:hypothetical protein